MISTGESTEGLKGWRSLKDLSAEIALAEAAVRSADQRLALRLQAIEARARQVRGWMFPLAGTLAPLAVLFFGRRRAVKGVGAAAFSPAASGTDPLIKAVQTVLPLVTPVIGHQAASILMALALHSSRAPAAALATAPFVDLGRYLGRWYEIARLGPRSMPGARREGGDVTVTYIPTSNGIKLINAYRRDDGRRERIVARVRVIDPATNAKLQVTSPATPLGWLVSLLRTGGESDRWILDVAPDYSTTLVGTPDRKNLWLLARTPTMPHAEQHTLLLRAAALGFAVDRVRHTPHGGSADTETGA